MCRDTTRAFGTWSAPFPTGGPHLPQHYTWGSMRLQRVRPGKSCLIGKAGVRSPLFHAGPDRYPTVDPCQAVQSDRQDAGEPDDRDIHGFVTNLPGFRRAVDLSLPCCRHVRGMAHGLRKEVSGTRILPFPSLPGEDAQDSHLRCVLAHPFARFRG